MPPRAPSTTSSPSPSTSPSPFHLTCKRKRASPSTSANPSATRSTLYDAVAGRLTTRASLLNPSQHASSSQNRDRIDRSLAPLRPAEALWRSDAAAAANTPRFAERDVYDSARVNLPPGARGEAVLRKAGGRWGGERDGEGAGKGEGRGYEVCWDGVDARRGRSVDGLTTEDFVCIEEAELEPDVARERQERLDLMRLPESDVCKAVHTYASDFYGALLMDGRDEMKRRERKGSRRRRRGRKEDGIWNFRSMDETALLAMGILLEESVAAMLGETGDMVFVEGETDHRDAEGDERDRSKTADIVGPTDAMGEDFGLEEVGDEPEKDRKKTKRVRVHDDEDSFTEDLGERRRRKKRRRLHYEGNEDY